MWTSDGFPILVLGLLALGLALATSTQAVVPDGQEQLPEPVNDSVLTTTAEVTEEVPEPPGPIDPPDPDDAPVPDGMATMVRDVPDPGNATPRADSLPSATRPAEGAVPEGDPDDDPGSSSDERDDGLLASNAVRAPLPCGPLRPQTASEAIASLPGVDARDCADVQTPDISDLVPSLLDEEEPEPTASATHWFSGGPGGAGSPASNEEPVDQAEEDPTQTPEPEPTARPQSNLRASPVEVPADQAMEYILAAAIGTLLLLPFLLLYRRLQPDGILENETRRATLELVEDNPGITAADVAGALEVDYRTATHHLEVLSEFGEIEDLRDEGRVRYFENHGALTRRTQALAACLASPARARVVRALAAEEALPSGDVADRAGIAPSTASHHLGRLADRGLIESSREGRRVLYRLTGRAREALVELAQRPTFRA